MRMVIVIQVNQNWWRGPQTQSRSQLEGIMSVGIPNEGILKACQGEHLKEVLGHHPPRVSQGNHLFKSASFSVNVFYLLIINNTTTIITITLVAKKSSAIVSSTEDCILLTSISYNYLELLPGMYPCVDFGLSIGCCTWKTVEYFALFWSDDLSFGFENKLGRCDSYLLNLKTILTHPLTDDQGRVYRI